MLYEYKCTECKEIVEKVQHPDDVGDHACECGGTLKRYIHTMPNLSPNCFESQKVMDVEDMTMRSYSEIKKKERETGRVWMGIDEHQKECKKNSDRIESETREKMSKEFQELAFKSLESAGIHE